MKNKKTLIIAEAGVNHDGKLNQALQLVEIAHYCGADAVKFQMFNSEKLVSKNAVKANYQRNSIKNETQAEMLKKLELNENDFLEIKKYCDKLGIKFLCSGFDNESVNFINKLNVQYFKIPSGEINNLPYLRNLGKHKKKIILSTGISTIDEIRKALNCLIKAGTKKSNISLLHCSSEYPAPFSGLNLSSIFDIIKIF